VWRDGEERGGRGISRRRGGREKQRYRARTAGKILRSGEGQGPEAVRVVER
jgi:hypothetical protein